MNRNVKPILSLSLAVFFMLGITACSPNVSEPAPTASSSSSSTASPSSSPSASPSVSESPAPTKESVEAGADGETELERAQKAFPKVDEEGAKDTKEAQLALYNMQEYIYDIYNRGYLANGSWEKNGSDSNELVESFGHNWSEQYRAKLEGLIEESKNGENETIRSSAGDDLFTHFIYFDNEEKKLAPPERCSGEDIGATSCLVGDTIKLNSDMSYFKDDDGTFYIEVNFIANVELLNDGVEGYIPLEYNIQLDMMKNPYPDEENLRPTYIVNDLGGTWKSGGWKEGEPSE